MTSTRHRLAKRHTRREARSQNHGSPVSGTTAGLPNQKDRSTLRIRELRVLRVTVAMRGRKDQEDQQGMTLLGNKGWLPPPLFFAVVLGDGVLVPTIPLISVASYSSQTRTR